ncbi:MAG: nitrate reductase [Pseudomonadota bacterium]
MYDLYEFVRGPLLWVSFMVFIGGSLYRFISLYTLAKKKDVFVFTYWSWKYALRSILHWIIPFGSTNMRQRPIMTVVSFAFHMALLAAPIFLAAHMVLWEESWGITWWSLPDLVADIMTIVVMVGLVFFLVRRKVLPEVKYVTSESDYAILAVVAAPFVTGFLAYHQWLIDYKVLLLLHILAGEIMLIAIPFTRLMHMILFPFTRGYMGSEFGSIRHARDW